MNSEETNMTPGISSQIQYLRRSVSGVHGEPIVELAWGSAYIQSPVIPSSARTMTANLQY